MKNANILIEATGNALKEKLLNIATGDNEAGPKESGRKGSKPGKK